MTRRKGQWKLMAVGDLLKGVIDYRGKTPPRADSGIPCLSAANVKGGRVTIKDKFVTKEVYEKWTTRGFIKPGDVLITTEAPVAEVALVPGDQTYLITRRVMALQVESSEANGRFLMYSLLLDENKKQLEVLSHGATVPRLYKEDILEFEFPVPPLPVQKKIASILSAYNDLIENNERRIRILEEMAQNLYREWFVKFRFPGHEKVKMVDSPLGKIPEGWEVELTKSLLKRLKQKNKYDQKNVEGSGAVPVIDQSAKPILGYHNNEPDFDVSSANPVIIFGDHTCKMELLVEPFSIGPNVVPFVAKKETPLVFLFFLVRSLVSTQEYKRHWTELCSKTVAVPTMSLMTQFAEIFAPFFEHRVSLIRKSNNLRQTRDLLLPKLISGQLDVSELDIEVPEEAA